MSSSQLVLSFWKQEKGGDSPPQMMSPPHAEAIVSLNDPVARKATKAVDGPAGRARLHSG